MKHITQLDVLMAGTRVGGLAMDARGVIWFAYDPGWVAQELEIDKADSII